MARGRPKGADATRTAIVEAAMRGFAEKGFAATGTREIAALAGTNAASITYRFGGEDGLRLACAEHVVALMGGVLEAMRQGELPSDPAAARAALTETVRRVVTFLLLDPQARAVASFVLRELSDPSPALDLIYARLFKPVHRRACAIWGVATGRDPESPGVRLAVFATIGQIVYFNFARPVIQRRMGWPTLGPAEVEAVADTLAANLHARLDADREHRP